MTAPSPFHPGEQELQRRTGRRDAMEKFGQRMIRPEMPDQHREFYAQLPFLAVGAVDDQGWPWASLLAGEPGFAHSPDPARLNVALHSAPDDPVQSALHTDAPLGLLGIELHTRRRNRVNGRIASLADGGFVLNVDQSFGNCPQYIHDREVRFVRRPGTPGTGGPATSFTRLDGPATAMIRQADTFFVASFAPDQGDPVTQGVDVSHRGGKPGFVRVQADTLTIPDFRGNFHFNTLGNFLINPRAGLVFADFDTGDLLHLTGTVELLEGDHPDIAGFERAERGWRFTLDHGVRVPDALPFRGIGGEPSRNSLATGEW